MIVVFDSADVKPAAIARPFAEGLIPPPVVRTPRRGPSALDLIEARAFSLCLDAECPLPPPSDLTSAEEIAAWQTGADAAGGTIHARYADAALEAEWLAEAESRASDPHAAWRD